MHTRKSLVSAILVFAVAAAVGWAASVIPRDTKFNSDHTPLKAVDVDLIFADDFESGDASAWGRYCTLSTLDLPLPAKGK